LLTPCLTFGITSAGPRFAIRWLVCLAGTGLSPVGIHDLARPHYESINIEENCDSSNPARIYIPDAILNPNVQGNIN